MMQRLVLREFRTEQNVALSVEQREALRRLHPGLRIEPAAFSVDRYDLTPNQRIGVVIVPGMVVEIRPKIPMASVLFLVSYACDAVTWFEHQPEFAENADFAEVIAVMLASLVEAATRRGLLHGYRSTEESLSAPRGRILFDEQLRRRFGGVSPIEV